MDIVKKETKIHGDEESENDKAMQKEQDQQVIQGTAIQQNQTKNLMVIEEEKEDK